MKPIALLGLGIAGYFLFNKLKQAAAAPNLTFTPMNPKTGKNANGQSGIIVPVSIFNPTTANYTLTGIVGNVSANGETLGELQYAGSKKIIANGYTTVDLFVVPNLGGILGSIINLIGGSKEVPAMLITGKAFLGNISIPFALQTKGATSSAKASNEVDSFKPDSMAKPMSGYLPYLQEVQKQADKNNIVIAKDTQGNNRAIPVTSIVAVPKPPTIGFQTARANEYAVALPPQPKYIKI
jgi:hypothetical protein